MRLDKYVDFKKDIWSKFGRAMWRKHQSVYQDHLEYICNVILKPFHVRNIHHAKCVQDIHNLANNLPNPSMKGNGYVSANWKFHNETFSVNDSQVAVKYGLPSSMQDEVEENQEDCNSLTHEDWWELLSTIKVKDNRKREATHQ